MMIIIYLYIYMYTYISCLYTSMALDYTKKQEKTTEIKAVGALVCH